MTDTAQGSATKADLDRLVKALVSETEKWLRKTSSESSVNWKLWRRLEGESATWEIANLNSRESGVGRVIRAFKKAGFDVPDLKELSKLAGAEQDD